MVNSKIEISTVTFISDHGEDLFDTNPDQLDFHFRSRSEEERVELLKISKRVFLSTRWIAFWLIIAIVTMAGARYF